MRADLLEDALAMAITLRGRFAGKLFFYPDRGTQYASEELTIFAKATRIARSIEERYDRQRRHASLNQLSPVACELRYSN